MKKVLKYIFCPILLLYNTNMNDKVVGIKSSVFKGILLGLIVAVIIFLFYIKEIFNL